MRHGQHRGISCGNRLTIGAMMPPHGHVAGSLLLALFRLADGGEDGAGPDVGRRSPDATRSLPGRWMPTARVLDLFSNPVPVDRQISVG